MAEEDFWADIININVIAINRQPISVYRKHIIEIAAINTNSITKFSNVSFIITDVKHYKAILDYL